MPDKYLRPAVVVTALHLNAETQPDAVADFVSQARGDAVVSFRPSSIRVTYDGREMEARVGDWLVLEKGALHVWTNSDFVDGHERV